MREFTISDRSRAVSALSYGRELLFHRPTPSLDDVLYLRGAPSDQLDLAALAIHLTDLGHSVVMLPASDLHKPRGEVQIKAASTMRADPDLWQVGLYTSGSTQPARAFGFSRAQLHQLAGWYTQLYGVTESSVIMTPLPVAYNFTFIAGLVLAATLGARLHIADSADTVFRQVRRLTDTHDRCIVLGNPVLLTTPPPGPLPDTVLIDSGGAPLTTAAIRYYREHVADLREGYGLTETGSLTHFDTEATEDSLGTVGRPVPGVSTWITTQGAQPRIVVASPAIGVPITHPGTGTSQLTTTDLGAIDGSGRLRVLGRSDDHQIAGLWPRDTLDIIGTMLGTACALVRHSNPQSVHVRLLDVPDPGTVSALKRGLADRTGLKPMDIRVDIPERSLLPSFKLPRTVPPGEIHYGT